MDTRGRGDMPRPLFLYQQKRPSLREGRAFCVAKEYASGAGPSRGGLFQARQDLTRRLCRDADTTGRKAGKEKRASPQLARRCGCPASRALPASGSAREPFHPPLPFSSGQARPLAREQVKVVAQASGAIEQGLAQGKIVRAAFAAQLPFPGLGSLGGIALVPGLDFLIVGRAFALFFDGQGIKFSFFPQVELTVQMAAAVDLRARGPGLCRCLPTSRDVS